MTSDPSPGRRASPADGPAAAGGRRAEYARATREAILTAARDLFTEQGYFATRVEEIARTARVAPATVYAVGGGKNGLIRTLIEEGSEAESAPDFFAAVAANPDPLDLVRIIVEGTGDTFVKWSPLMRQVYAAAASEPAVRDSLAVAHTSLRDGLSRIADRLASLDALQPGMTAADATDILWFHLGNTAWFTLTDDLAWPLGRAKSWLRTTLAAALLR